MRTDVDPRVLVVTFLGGEAAPGCYGPVTAKVTEGRHSVAIALTTHPAPGPTPSPTDRLGHRVPYGCSGVGVLDSLAVRLRVPLGGRTVVDPYGAPDGHTVTRHAPFDGTHLLTPTELPGRYALSYESTYPDPFKPVTWWTRTWTGPDLRRTGGAVSRTGATPPQGGSVPEVTGCRSTLPPVQLTQYSSALTRRPFPSSAIVGHMTVRGARATVYRGRDLGTALVWTDPVISAPLLLESLPTCRGGAPLTTQSLAAIAASLAEQPTCTPPRPCVTAAPPLKS